MGASKRGGVATIVSLVLAVLSLGVSGFSVFLSYSVQGSVALYVASYASNYRPETHASQYSVTIRLTNAGPGVAKDVVFGVLGLDGGTRFRSDRPQQPIGVNMSVGGVVLVDVATAMLGLSGDPTTVLKIWVMYRDSAGNHFQAQFPPWTTPQLGPTAA